MPHTLRKSLFAAVVLVASLSACTSRSTVDVARDDTQMNQAMSRARAEALDFIARLQKPASGESGFALKVPISEGDQTEHFWLEQVRYEGGRFAGRLANEPEVVKKYRYGQEVSAVPGEISDWMYVRDGRLVGGYTLRVLRDRMSASERVKFDESLGFKID